MGQHRPECRGDRRPLAALFAATKAEFNAWGPGKYDPRHHAVVDHYDQQFVLGLSAEQKSDLVEFLKSL